MKRNIFIVVTIFLCLFTIVGCGNTEEEKESTGLKFKNDYEELNGKENAHGKIHRSVTISENNVFVETTAEEIVKMIEEERSFYVYFGSTLCPWCRSTIEMADKISRENDIAKVYYVDIWDDEGNEILRDKYTLENGELVVSVEKNETYSKLLTYFDSLLDDYNLTDENGNSVPTGEKRIYAPNYFYVKDGKAVRITTGISDLQEDSREELTEEMLNDEEEKFGKFFVNACDDKC